ncbi:unnamed protein product [Scytosiphon promiscuus]
MDMDISLPVNSMVGLEHTEEFARHQIDQQPSQDEPPGGLLDDLAYTMQPQQPPTEYGGPSARVLLDQPERRPQQQWQAQMPQMGKRPEHQQHQRPPGRSWPQQEAQIHQDVSQPPPPPQQQQQQQQQKQQALARESDQRNSSLLSDYAPPAAFSQVNVPVLMQQTAAAIVRWGELQKKMDVTSDAASANLAAQTQVRSSLKRDLTNLTQLADAQTKHTQRMKMRQMQAMQQTTITGNQHSFRGGVVPAVTAAGGVAPPVPIPGVRSSLGGAQGVASETRGGGPVGETFNNVPSRQVAMQQPPGVLANGPVLRAAGATNPSPYASGVSAGAPLMQQGGGGGSGGGSGGGGVSGAPPGQGNRHQGVRQRIDRTESGNKWVVLVEASLRLPPTDGPTFKQFTLMIQNCLNNYNGEVGAEVARALGTCLDPRVFDPSDIKRAQERMADIYSRFRRS